MSLIDTCTFSGMVGNQFYSQLSALVQKNDQVQFESPEIRNAFIIAVQLGYTNVVDVFLKSNIDLRDAVTYCEKREPVVLAAYMRSRDLTLDRLLGAGADVNKTDSSGNTLIHVAALMKDKETVAKAIKAGADVDKRGEFGYTPLCIAAALPNESVVETLIAARANIEKADEDGHTPLYWATRSDRFNIVLRLIGSDAKVTQEIIDVAKSKHIKELLNDVYEQETICKSHALVIGKQSDGKVLVFKESTAIAIANDAKTALNRAKKDLL